MKVTLQNNPKNHFKLKKKQHIAKIIFRMIQCQPVKQTSQLEHKPRVMEGFGSTERKQAVKDRSIITVFHPTINTRETQKETDIEFSSDQYKNALENMRAGCYLYQ